MKLEDSIDIYLYRKLERSPILRVDPHKVHNSRYNYNKEYDR